MDHQGRAGTGGLEVDGEVVDVARGIAATDGVEAETEHLALMRSAELSGHRMGEKSGGADQSFVESLRRIRLSDSLAGPAR